MYTEDYIDGLVQDWSNSSALAMELLQFCSEPSTQMGEHDDTISTFWPMTNFDFPNIL